MKLSAPFVVWASCALASTVQDKPVKKVVKLLQEMLETSKKEGDEERVTYAKFKCYCDDNKQEKTDSIAELGQRIGFLETKIAELKGESGQLSQEVAKLEADMKENAATREGAKALREKSEEVFEGEESDMKNAIKGFKDAMKVLAELGGDSLMETGDRKKLRAHSQSLLAEGGLAKAQDTVRGAVAAVSSLLTPEQRAAVESFLQAPSAQTSSQSGAIVKILKQMLDTFEDNLKNAQDAEEAEQKSYASYKEDKEEEHKTFEEARDSKKEQLAGNNGELASKKEQLGDAIQQKEDDEEFLAKLIANCEQKAKEYTKRKMMRTSEEAAIAEAIAILNSDDAFGAFGKTDATSTGGTSFLQTSSDEMSLVAVEAKVTEVLTRAVRKSKSLRLAKVATMVNKGNPFDKVIAEIEKMLKLIEEEGKEDKKQLDFCDSEREANDAELSKRKDQIETLNEDITSLDDAINNPETGLLVQIEDTEKDIVKNNEDQATETETRRKEHTAYLKDVAADNKAQAILKKAIHVLKRYYAAMEKQTQDDLLQLHVTQDPPETWDKYEGQSKQGKEVLDMIEFILEESEKEEVEADKDEKDAKEAYDSTMADLKSELENLQEQLVGLKEDLAETEKELAQTKIDLKDTEHAKKAIEKYIEEIKPGCDFITENFDTREENRKIETEALQKADTLIKDTPAYKKFEEKKN